MAKRISNIGIIVTAIVELAEKYPKVSQNGILYHLDVPSSQVTKYMEENGIAFPDRAEKPTSPQRYLTSLFPDFDAMRLFISDYEELKSIQPEIEQAQPVQEELDEGPEDLEEEDDVEFE